ncbi:MAG: outer membrane beta-barrel protein [Xanthobacteraceae bacterium]|nr:outer membrane beta-barrel protein [Xanthobacteraceae bacterium]
MRLKYLMLATVSSLALTGVATAADMPLKVREQTAAPAHTWTGFYVGGSLGIAYSRTSGDISDPMAFDGYGAYNMNRLDRAAVGWIGGGQAGYNWQSRRFVFGVEGDLSYLSATGTVSGPYVDSGDSVTVTSKPKAFASVRGRFGWDFDGTLVYGTAGLGWLKTEHNTYVNALSGGVPKGGNFRSDKWAPAIVVGGGVEHMISRNWSVRGEVLWVYAENVDAGPTDNRYFPAGAPSSGGAGVVKYDQNVVLGRFGVNYKF